MYHSNLRSRNYSALILGIIVVTVVTGTAGCSIFSRKNPEASQATAPQPLHEPLPTPGPATAPLASCDATSSATPGTATGDTTVLAWPPEELSGNDMAELFEDPRPESRAKNAPRNAGYVEYDGKKKIFYDKNGEFDASIEPIPYDQPV